MRESDFTNPSGRFEKNDDGLPTFVPNRLPPDIDYDPLIGLITEAHRHIGLLEGIGNLLPNPDLLIRPYVMREAVFSSSIEGTEASMLDVFRFGAGKKTDADERKRVREVFNYVETTDYCFDQIGYGKIIDVKLLKHAHKRLLDGVRGQKADPGDIRTAQNWIGRSGCKIRDATYVPPAADLLDNLLSDLVQFIMDKSQDIPILVRCALVHYQFESIHPFGDGNGRIGRLLILLILANRDILSKPLLYLSSYFERYRSEYYERLRDISTKSEWTGWIEFFLRGVIECSKDAIDTTKEFLKLKSDYETRLKDSRASRSSMLLTEYLFSKPVVTIPLASEHLQIGYPPAKNAVMYLVNLGILEQVGPGRRAKTYVAREILDVFS